MAWFRPSEKEPDDDRPATAEDLRQMGDRFRRLCIGIILAEVAVAIAVGAVLTHRLHAEFDPIPPLVAPRTAPPPHPGR